MIKKIAFAAVIAASFLVPAGLSAHQGASDQGPSYELAQYVVPPGRR